MAFSICKLSTCVRPVCGSAPRHNIVARVASRDTMASLDAREQFESKPSKQMSVQPSQKSEGIPQTRRSLSVEGLVEFDAPAYVMSEPTETSLYEDKQWEEKIDHSLA